MLVSFSGLLDSCVLRTSLGRTLSPEYLFLGDFTTFRALGPPNHLLKCGVKGDTLLSSLDSLMSQLSKVHPNTGPAGLLGVQPGAPSTEPGLQCRNTLFTLYIGNTYFPSPYAKQTVDFRSSLTKAQFSPETPTSLL